jgi:hypothetical protein
MCDTLVSEHLVGELHNAAKAYRDELSEALHHVFLELDRRSFTAKIEKLDALQGPWWAIKQNDGEYHNASGLPKGLA